MEFVFLAKFSKDLDKIKDQSVLSNVVSVVEEVENAKTLSTILNMKKLKGFKNVYRVKIGDYRIGFYFENETLEFARIVHRKDIYKVFP